MAYNVTNLSTYVEEQRPLLIKDTLIGAMTVNKSNIQTGLRGKTAINILDVTATLQDGSECGFNPSGDDTFTQRYIEPVVLKVNKQWCDKALLNKWAEYEVRIGADDNALPFEEMITSKITKNVADSVEKLIWQGDSTHGVGELALMDGLLVTLGTAVPSGNKTTAIQTDTIYERAYAVYNKIPEYAIDNTVILMSYANYRDLALALMEKNLYHYTADIDSSKEFILPGTSTKVVACPGLNGVDTIVAVEWDNIYVGVDLQNDMEAWDLFYSKDDRVFKLAIEFLIGVNVAFPDRIVLGLPYAG